MSTRRIETRSRRITPKAIFASLLWVALAGSSDANAADASRGQALAAKGNTRGALACVACHGTQGEGNAQANYPQLAGQSAEYIKHQLESFKNKTRNNTVMLSIAASLSPQEMDDISAYYAGLSWHDVPQTNKKVIDNAQAKKIVHEGEWNKNQPACFSCHGPQGTGVGIFPRIAGQYEPYLVAQLDAWRKGTRHNDHAKLMNTTAKKLSTQEVGLVAAYLANYRPNDRAAAPAPQPGMADKKPVPPPKFGKKFTPPPETEIPNDGFGEMVRKGKNIFVDTQTYAKQYVGNGLNCVNCHLDAGRKADSAPMWGAYVLYPAFRTKNKKVNTMQERIQGCFTFSENGKAPPVDSDEITALVSYFYWMARGAPTGMKISGQGYQKLAEPKQKPDKDRGAKVFAANCSVCHGPQGQGQKSGDRYVFPPLWGPDSFNGGAGMSKIKNASAFIKANMPLGHGGSLSDQDAWDVAAFMDGQDRPPDPRKRASSAKSVPDDQEK